MVRRASGSPAREALARAGLEPIAAAGEGRALAHQRHAVHGGVRRARRSCARAGSRRRPTSRARSRSRRCRARGRASSRRSTRCGRCAARSTRPRTSSRCSRARRSSRRTAGATRCRTPTRSAARRRCTARRRDLLDYVDYTVAVELNAATDNPLVLVEDEHARLERQLPRPAARVRARRAGDGGRRAREHLRAARRAARQPDALRRAAARSSPATAGSTPAS